MSAPGVQPGFLLAQRGRCYQRRTVTTALSSMQTGAWHIVGAHKHPLMNAGDSSVMATITTVTQAFRE